MMRTLASFFYTHKRRTLLLAGLWTVVILTACFIPGDEVPDIGIFQVDKLAHIILFGGCAFLWGMFLVAGREHRRLLLLAAGVVSVVLGILVELVQSTSWVRGRGGDIWDAVADAVGAVAGVLLVNYAVRLLEKK